MKEKILKLRDEGMSYRSIQKKIGCSKSTISYHCGEGRKNRQAKYFNNLRRGKRKEQRMFSRRVRSIFGCKDCGINDWRVLDFDHVRGVKLFNVSHIASFSLTMDVFKNEMRKCEIRCSNCHRIKTYDERNDIML